jgi:DNA gyrase/topoisomerase IV subunit B
VKEACLQSLEPIEKISDNAIGGPPELEKSFDNLMKGALQNCQHERGMNTLNVTINRWDNIISVWYNGKGLPVVLDLAKGLYIPTVIFQRVVLGRLPCISLVVETGDSQCRIQRLFSPASLIN